MDRPDRRTIGITPSDWPRAKSISTGARKHADPSQIRSTGLDRDRGDICSAQTDAVEPSLRARPRITSVAGTKEFDQTPKSGWRWYVNPTRKGGAFAWPENNSRDAALVITLQPGNYTAHISGVGNTSSIALIEIYELP